MIIVRDWEPGRPGMSRNGQRDTPAKRAELFARFIPYYRLKSPASISPKFASTPPKSPSGPTPRAVRNGPLFRCDILMRS